MDEPVDRDVVQQLISVIAWEPEAQAGVHRPVEKMPPHVADTILDYFDGD